MESPISLQRNALANYCLPVSLHLSLPFKGLPGRWGKSCHSCMWLISWWQHGCTKTGLCSLCLPVCFLSHASPLCFRTTCVCVGIFSNEKWGIDYERLTMETLTDYEELVLFGVSVNSVVSFTPPLFSSSYPSSYVLSPQFVHVSPSWWELCTNWSTLKALAMPIPCHANSLQTRTVSCMDGNGRTVSMAVCVGMGHRGDTGTRARTLTWLLQSLLSPLLSVSLCFHISRKYYAADWAKFERLNATSKQFKKMFLKQLECSFRRLWTSNPELQTSATANTQPVF